MGGQLVKLAFHATFVASQRGEVLSANERQVLLYMASVAHDDDAIPRYWGGRETLAEVALGRRLPLHGQDPKARESILKSVSIATRRLVARGWIRLGPAARPGRQQEYEIAVENLIQPSTHREPEVPPFGTSHSTARNVTFHRSESDVPPEEQPNQEDQEDTTNHLRKAPHVSPVEKAGAAA